MELFKITSLLVYFLFFLNTAFALKCQRCEAVTTDTNFKVCPNQKAEETCPMGHVCLFGIYDVRIEGNAKAHSSTILQKCVPDAPGNECNIILQSMKNFLPSLSNQTRVDQRQCFTCTKDLCNSSKNILPSKVLVPLTLGLLALNFFKF